MRSRHHTDRMRLMGKESGPKRASLLALGFGVFPAAAWAAERVGSQVAQVTHPVSSPIKDHEMDVRYDDIQLDLILSYKTNVALYPDFQRYFRETKPPLLAVWGRNDPFFIPPGAEAYRRDLPDVEIHFLDTGHFALETHHSEIASLMREFLQRHGV